MPTSSPGSRFIISAPLPPAAIARFEIPPPEGTSWGHWLLCVRGSTLVAQPFDPDKATFSGDAIPIAEQVATVGPSIGAFSVSQNGVLVYRRALPTVSTQLTWYDRSGNMLGTVGEDAIYTNPALSPDGKRLAVSRLDPSTNTTRHLGDRSRPERQLTVYLR